MRLFRKKDKVKRIKYVPKKDITTWELAMCMTVVISDYNKCGMEKQLDLLEPEAKRHFEEVWR